MYPCKLRKRLNTIQIDNINTKYEQYNNPDVLVRVLCTWEVKSCCCSCRPSLKSQDRTVLSRPPVHSLVPSLEMSIQLAPSVWPWNCLQIKCTVKRSKMQQSVNRVIEPVQMR